VVVGRTCWEERGFSVQTSLTGEECGLRVRIVGVGAVSSRRREMSSQFGCRRTSMELLRSLKGMKIVSITGGTEIICC
jgi:hypothetical protein